MKLLRVFLITIALLFAFLVVFIPVGQEHHLGLAEEEVIPLLQEEEKIASPAAQKKEEKVDYYLPYPGILPDHPFYWLKMIRDRILLFFTKEPVAHFERLLLYADKRVGAAEALIKGGKESLGVSTATKAEKYLEQAIQQLEALKKEEKMTAIVVDKALRAAAKHKEILEELMDKTTEDKGILSQTLEMTERSYQKVLEIVGKKE